MDKKEKYDLLSNIDALFSHYFDSNIYEYQRPIIESILWGQNRETVIKATTRAGKSWAVAHAVVIKAILCPNHRIGVIAPSHPKTKIIGNYIFEALVRNEELVRWTDIDTKDYQKLKKEVSKKRITFKNGSSIEFLTADPKGGGFSLMGFGYGTIIIDEMGEIPDEIMGKITRMLGDSPDSILIGIGNPWFLNQFYRAFLDSRINRITITWKDCVKEGRITQEHIDREKERLTAMEFRVLYEAEFPTEAEFSIFKNDWLLKAKKDKKIENIIYGIGIDVARGGKDLTVLTVLAYDTINNEIRYVEHETMDSNDTMKVYDLADKYHDKYKSNEHIITLDIMGVGAGVFDLMRREKYPVRAFVSGNKPVSKRFYNKKSETIFSLAKVMEDGNFYNYPYNSQYTIQLLQWEYEVKTDRRIRVIDPDKNTNLKEDKSPDYADSLVIAFEACNPKETVRVLKSGSLFG